MPSLIVSAPPRFPQAHSRRVSPLPTATPAPLAEPSQKHARLPARAAPFPETSVKTSRSRFSAQSLDPLSESAPDSPRQRANRRSLPRPSRFPSYPRHAPAPRIPPASSQRSPRRPPPHPPPPPLSPHPPNHP